MVIRALVFLFLVLTCGYSAHAQSHTEATLWFYQDLAKLDRPCVNVWARALDKKQRPAKDSTLAYCLYYDTAARRMDAVYWNIQRTYKGGIDTLRRVELHHEFDVDGDKVFEVQREAWRLIQNGDSSMYTTLTRLERAPDGRLIREVSVILSTSLVKQGGERVRWTDSTNWRIDSLFFNGTIHARTVSSAHGDLLRDSTLFLHANDSSWSRQVEYSRGSVTRSTTILHHAGHPILQIDSMFFQCGQKRIGLRVSESRSSYDGELLVEVEETDWYKAYEFPRNWLMADSPACPTLKYPPVREHRHNVYMDGKLLRSIWYTEKEYRLDSTVYVPVGGYMLREGEPDPVLSRLSSGLPLIVLERDRSRRLFFEYTDKRPSYLPGGRDLDPLKTWEPRQ